MSRLVSSFGIALVSKAVFDPGSIPGVARSFDWYP